MLLAHELAERGLAAERQVAVPLTYKNVRFDLGFRADLIVEDRVLVELKSVERLAPAHKKQVLTDLKIRDLRLGLLVNFGAAQIKDHIVRLVYKLDEPSS